MKDKYLGSRFPLVPAMSHKGGALVRGDLIKGYVLFALL